MELNKENAQQWWNKNVKKIELQDKTIKKLRTTMTEGEKKKKKGLSQHVQKPSPEK